MSHDPSEIMLTLVLKKKNLIFVHLFEIETRLYTFEIETQKLYVFTVTFYYFGFSMHPRLINDVFLIQNCM